MSLYGALAETERNGKELLCGRVELDSAEAEIVTPFRTIDAVIATVQEDGAPATTVVTYEVNDNVVTLYGWAPTSSSVTTLVATSADDVVDYVIIGRPR